MTRRNPQSAVALAVAGLFASGCFLDNDVLDASCTPGEPDITLNPDCPYQQSRGPQVPPGVCVAQQDAASATPSWTEVFNTLVRSDGGNCSAIGCHGGPSADQAALGIWLPADKDDIFYETLTNTTGSIGKPYVNADNPPDSWIHCNVGGRAGGGSLMPKPGGMTQAVDALLIENWILSDAPYP
jgi:hypothetical protein